MAPLKKIMLPRALVVPYCFRFPVQFHVIFWGYFTNYCDVGMRNYLQIGQYTSNWPGLRGSAKVLQPDEGC